MVNNARTRMMPLYKGVLKDTKVVGSKKKHKYKENQIKFLKTNYKRELLQIA